MAHKSREPQRKVRGKLTIPRERGEKYVAPQILPGEDSGLAWSKEEAPDETVAQELRRRAQSQGLAHDLIRKLDLGIRREQAKRGG